MTICPASPLQALHARSMSSEPESKKGRCAMKNVFVSKARQLFAACIAALFACACMAGVALAVETDDVVTQDGFTFHLYIDEGTGNVNSLWLEKYTGSETKVTLPSAIVYKGKQWPVEELGAAFKGNTKITEIIIPEGYQMIGEEAFQGCTGLKKVVIGSTVKYIGNAAFEACPNLKEYRIGYRNASGMEIGTNAIGAIGKDGNGKVYEGITAYVVNHSSPEGTIAFKINTMSSEAGGATITISHSDDPAAAAKVTRVITIGESSSGSSGNSSSASDPAKQMGEGGKAVAKGASAQAAEAALVKWKKESDPAGSVFNGLQLKMAKVTKTSVKISWKKPKGTKSYVVYAAKCGSAYKKLKVLGASKKSLTVKKVAGKKVKKGTYYKFIVVALSKASGKGNVVSTSKTVHVATKGGKVGNDKKVKTAAKKGKLSLKKGKSFKLKAKAVPASKKLKVKKHRKIKYESSNPKVAKVSTSGKITALKKKKTCYIYAYAQDGIAAKIKVTVK